MSLNRYAARRDSNEPPLVAAARQIGAQMEKAGPLDWWCAWRGEWFPVEIKTKSGTYTDEQVLFIARCKEHGSRVDTWRDFDDVFKSLNARQTA
jgi:hypothetical protein